MTRTICNQNAERHPQAIVFCSKREENYKARVCSSALWNSLSFEYVRFLEPDSQRFERYILALFAVRRLPDSNWSGVYEENMSNKLALSKTKIYSLSKYF